jgi:2-polyprenyl-3-methyl-5-hydroxy-6-metoxy-1,4-benzoquinol methylase
MIRRLREYFETSDSILDYACGPGVLLGQLIERGYRVAGTDSSPRSLDVVSTRFSGRDNFLGVYSPDELQSLGQRFDCVFVVELLEHLDDNSLNRTLEGLKRLVHPSGRIIITTPNREVLSESYVLCPSCEQVFHRWQHVRRWSRETLTAVLEEHGFEVVEAFSTDFSKIPGRWKAFRRRYLSRRKPDKERPHLVVICRPPRRRDSAV